MSTSNTTNTSSVSTLQAKYDGMKAQWDSRNIFGKTWSLAHLSLDASFEMAFTTLVWAQVVAHVASQAAIQTAESCDAGLFFWAQQNKEWKNKIAKIETGAEKEPEQLKLF